MHPLVFLSIAILMMSCGQSPQRDRVKQPKAENSDAGLKGKSPDALATQGVDVAKPKDKDASKPKEQVAQGVPVPIEERSLPAPTGTAYTRKNAGTRVLPVTGAKVFLGDSPPAGSSFVVGTGRGRSMKWYLVDAQTGKRLASFGSSWIGSAAGKVAVVGKDAGANATQALLHMGDGTLVEPKPQLPSGEVLRRWRIVVDEQSPTVWLFAESDSGKTYHGQWQNLRKTEVAVADFPFWPTMASGQRGIVVWTQDVTECGRFELVPGKGPACRPGQLSFGFGSEPLAEMWTHHQGALLRNDQDGRETTLLAECRGVTAATLKSPPRVLAACVPKTGTAQFLLWSPDKSWHWDGPLDLDAYHGSMRREPVLALEQVGKMGVPVSRWIDLEHGIQWTSEPLAPLALAGAFGFHRQILGRPLSQPQSLWRLDLDAGTSELLIDKLDCKGELQQDDISDERAIISCREKGGYRWSEVIDFNARTRWRSKIFDARLSPSGIAVGTLRGRRAKLAVIETK